MKLLHVFFSSVVNPRHRFLGTTKDIRGRTQYFEERGIDYEELILKVRKEKYFLRGLERISPEEFDVALIEGTYFPETVLFLRKNYPHLRILMRGINAEIYHWTHSAHAALFFDTFHRVLFDLKGGLKFGLSDILCAHRAHYILPIAAWETRFYWRFLATSRRVVTMPYFLPDSYLKSIPASRLKKPQCVCMMTTKAGRPFLVDAARNLYRLVNRLGKSDWNFCITGDFESERLPPCPRVEVKGVLENPLELLAESRAVALLSDYGFGFKTKLLEAICCGCMVLVTKKLYARLPRPVKKYCIIVDARSDQSFLEALDRCMEPFPGGDANTALRDEAYAALDTVLGIRSVEPVSGGGISDEKK